MKYLLYINLMMVLLISSCGKDKDLTPSNQIEKIHLAEKKTTSGLTVTLWADKEKSIVAYNKLYVSIKNANGSMVSDAAVSYLPIMNMMTMSHSCAVEQPEFNSETGLYDGAVIFSMASGEMGTWTLTVTVNNEPLIFDMTIANPASGVKLTGTYMGTDGQSYSLALIQPIGPKIGMNNLEILINKRETMMSFPPAEDLTVELTPEMPSMGHGSPNNTSPVHATKGRYKGKVNFTMTGDWRLHFRLKKGNIIIVEDATLDLLF